MTNDKVLLLAWNDETLKFVCDERNQYLSLSSSSSSASFFFCFSLLLLLASRNDDILCASNAHTQHHQMEIKCSPAISSMTTNDEIAFYTHATHGEREREFWSHNISRIIWWSFWLHRMHPIRVLWLCVCVDVRIGYWLLQSLNFATLWNKLMPNTSCSIHFNRLRDYY